MTPLDSDGIRRALNEGTTLTTRFFLSIAGLLQGAGYLLKAPSWLSAPVYQSYNAVVPIEAWGVAFMTVGALGMWRVLSPRARPGAAWAVNILVALVWNVGLAARLLLGTSSLLSMYTAVALMAFWCLLRTEATTRDTRTA